MAIQVITLMLKHASHNPFAFQRDGLTLEVNAGYTSIVSSTRLIPQSRYRKAALIAVLLTAGLHEYRIKNVAYFSVDVVGERT